MNILTTGGAGFIGSHMAERLVTDGHHVVVVDNEAMRRGENVSSVAPYVGGAFNDQACLENSFAWLMDVVFRLAVLLPFLALFADPQVTLRTIFGERVNLLKLCL